MTLFTSHDLSQIEYLLTHFEGFDEIYHELFQMREEIKEQKQEIQEQRQEFSGCFSSWQSMD